MLAIVVVKYVICVHAHCMLLLLALFCLLMDLHSDVLQSVAHCWHNLFAVPDSVQKEVNLSILLDDELTNHPQLQPLAKSLPGILVQDRAPRTVSSYVRAYQAWKNWAIQC